MGLKVSMSDFGHEVKWCPECGACADWWMQQEYYANMLRGVVCENRNRRY